MRYQLLVLTVAIGFFGATTSAQTSENILQWLQNLKPAPGVYAELSKFQGLPEVYIHELPNFMKTKMTTELLATLQPMIQSQVCQPRINVQFLKSVSPDAAQNSAVADFESNLVRIEQISCIPSIGASKVAETFLSNEYQKKAFDTVVTSESRGESVCQKTQTAGLGASQYCYTNQKFTLPGAVTIHSFNESNQAGIAVPVYFREILTSVVDLPHETLFYSAVYVRSVNFSMLMKSFAKTIISQSQSKAMNVLAEMSK